MRELLWGVLHTSGTKIYSLSLALATLSLTARWLGPEGRGQLVAITTWVTMFSTMGHLSLGQVALHRSIKNKSEKWLGVVLGSLLALAVVFTAICWVVAATTYFLTNGRGFGPLPGWLLFLTFAAVPLYIWEQYGSSLLMSLNKIGIYNKYQVIGRTVGLFTLILLVSFFQFGISGAIYSTIIGQFIVAISGIKFLYQQAGGKVTAEKKEMLALLRGGGKLHWNAIGVIAFGTADILIINYYLGASEAGFYQLAAQLIAVMLIVPQAVSMIMYGKISSLGPDAAWPYHKKILIYTATMLFIGSILAWFLAPWIIVLVAGAEFVPAVSIFRWLLLAVMGMAFSNVMTPQWIGRGLFLQAAFITILVGILSASANFLLVPHFGVVGAAWSAIGAYGVSAFFNLGMVFFCNKKAT